MLAAIGFAARLIEYRKASGEYAAIARQMEGTTLPSPPPAAAEAAPAGISETRSPIPVMTPAFYVNRELVLLKAQNNDTAAYLDIEGTAIHYPVVHTRDNTYYENHTFLKKKNASGAIFLDSANDPGLSDFNLVIYGHHMRDGSMFHDLLQYSKDAFANAHRHITLTAPFETRNYYVFSAYSCSSSSSDMRGFKYTTDEQRQMFINNLIKRSDISAATASFPSGCQIMTLITCRENAEKDLYVVHAVRTE